jgi:hypothetical protein
MNHHHHAVSGFHLLSLSTTASWAAIIGTAVAVLGVYLSRKTKRDKERTEQLGRVLSYLERAFHPRTSFRIDIKFKDLFGKKKDD